MAKKQDYLDPITQEVDKEKINQLPTETLNAAELEKVLTVKRRLMEMDKWRSESCPWYYSTAPLRHNQADEYSEDSEGVLTRPVTTSGNDWVKRWVRDDDLYWMRPNTNRISSGLPPVSSSIVFAPVQAQVAQFLDANTTVNCTPMVGCNPNIARIGNETIRNIEEKNNIRELKGELFKSCAIRGSAITYNGYLTKKRTVKTIRNREDIEEEMGITEEEIQRMVEETMAMTGMQIDAEQIYAEKQAEIERLIQKNPEKLLLKEEEIIDFDDVMLEVVPLEELYVDPGAESFNGTYKSARDCCWVQYLPVQQVISMFKNSADPFIKKENITAELIKHSNSFGLDSKDQETVSILKYKNNSDLVCLVRYYNKETDQFLIVANGCLIRDGVLPYNHKQLPFSIYKYIPVPNCFYGVGLGTLLDNIQQSDELFLAIQQYLAEIEANLPTVAKSPDGNFSEQLKEVIESKEPLKAGQIIQMKSNEEISRIEAGKYPYDLDKVRSALDENTIKITGINPLMNSLPQNNQAVRNNQMVQESSLLQIRMVVNNWGIGYADAIKQLLHIIKQMQPSSYERREEAFEGYTGAKQIEAQKKKFKSIEMKNTEVGEDGLKDSSQSMELELTPEYTDSFDKLKVSVNVETMALASRQLQSQQISETMDKVMLVRSNPMLKDDPLVNSMLKDYLEKQSINPKYFSLLQMDDTTEGDELAEIQNQLLDAGQEIAPIAGMSHSHIQKHTQLLVDALMTKTDLEDKLGQMMTQMQESSQPTGDPMQDQMMMQQMMQMQQEGSQMSAQVDALSKLISRIRKHLAGDTIPRDGEAQAALTMSQPPAPAMPPQMAAQPQGQPEGMPMNPMPPQGQM